MAHFYLVASIAFVAGLVLFLLPPRKRNWLYGYRTSASMKSEAAFKYANRLSALLLVACSALFFGIGLLFDELFNVEMPFWSVYLIFVLTIGITEVKVRKFNAKV
jgi:uncharacterized membrane protein